MPRRWLAGILAGSAVYAVAVIVVSTDDVHRTWGAIAACGYALALLAALASSLFSKAFPRIRDYATSAAVVLAFAGGLVIPTGWLITHGLMQPEVAVIARSGAGLIHHGAPYASAASLAGTTDPNAYNPYLPVMALFGVPRALADVPFTDPRIWFAVAFAVIFWLALRRAGARDAVRWTALVTGSPVIAFTLSTGGDDAPMIALLCLGFACLWGRPGDRRDGASPAVGSPVGVSPVGAGLALGLAAAMKATAWPAVAVAIALLAASSGRRAVIRFTVAAAGIAVVCAGPFLAQEPKALIDNTVKFPLGLAGVVSAAASPLPGHLIAETGRIGHTLVIGVLVLAGLVIAASLVFRPPRTVPRAMWVLAGSMTLMFLLAPSTRFGYFIYPLTLVIWTLVARAGRSRTEPDPSTVVPCVYDEAREKSRLARRHPPPAGVTAVRPPAPW